VLIKVEENVCGAVLLQQYAVSWGNDGVSVYKGDRGSCLRRIPKIYDTF
jgi:hypothetical protein